MMMIDHAEADCAEDAEDALPQINRRVEGAEGRGTAKPAEGHSMNPRFIPVLVQHHQAIPSSDDQRERGFCCRGDPPKPIATAGGRLNVQGGGASVSAGVVSCACGCGW